MSDAPERIVPSCVEALESYHQADMDGIMVLVSRQAIHETIDAYWARVETCEELEAKLAKAVDRLLEIAEYENGDWVTYTGEAPPEIKAICGISRTTLAAVAEPHKLKGPDDE